MVIEIFFDLQRFADDTLVSDATGFTWKNGTFAGRVSSVPTASIGTEDEPAHWDAKGQAGRASILVPLFISLVMATKTAVTPPLILLTITATLSA